MLYPGLRGHPMCFVSFCICSETRKVTLRKSRRRLSSPARPGRRPSASAPLTWHFRQKHFPCMPICDANSLDIGLSPRNARIQGTTSTNSFFRASQARIPFRCALLKVRSYYHKIPTCNDTHQSCSTTCSIISSGGAMFEVAK